MIFAMKKIYLIPSLKTQWMGCETLIAESLNKYASGADEGVVLVKEDRATGGSSYNVWNDDWNN